MPLPASRDYTATEGGPLPPEVINNLQDAVFDHEARLGDGERKLILPLSAAVITPDGGTAPTATTRSVSIPSQGGSNSAGFEIPISLEVGRRIRSALVYVSSVAPDGDALHVRLRRTARAAPGTVLTVSTSEVGFSTGEKVAGSIDHVLEEDHAYHLQVEATDPDGGTTVISYVELTVDRPAP
jgi:hypothetical protein